MRERIVGNFTSDPASVPSSYLAGRLGIDKTPDDSAWRYAVAQELRTRKFKRKVKVDDPDDVFGFKVVNRPYVTESFEFQNCGDPKRIGFYWACKTDPQHGLFAVPQHCGLRICPICAKRQFHRLREFYLPHVLDAIVNGPPGFSPKHIELGTDIHLHDPLLRQKIQRTFRLVPKLFDKLLPKGWRKSQGYISAFEFGAKGLRLHFHLYFYGEYIPFADLQAAWARLTGIQGVHVYIKKKPPTQALNYVLKYATKLTKLDPADMVLLYHVMHGLRRVRAAGIFFGLGKIERPGRKIEFCPVCGGELVLWSPRDYDLYKNGNRKLGGEGFSSQIGNKSPPVTVLGQNRTAKPELKIVYFDAS
jgi:hypothetical protein